MTAPAGATAATALAPAAVLEVRDLVVRYGSGRKARNAPPAVDGVSFDIAPGETLGLVGESGSGKSTIGKAVLGLQPPTSGTVKLHGQDITRMPLKQRSRLVADLRVVFQDPYSSLNPARTIGQTLVEPLRLMGIEGRRGAGEGPRRARVGRPARRRRRPLPDRSSPAVSASASRSPGRWSATRRSSSSTSRCRRSTSPPRRRCSTCSPTCATSAAWRSCSSPTTWASCGSWPSGRWCSTAARSWRPARSRRSPSSPGTRTPSR